MVPHVQILMEATTVSVSMDGLVRIVQKMSMIVLQPPVLMEPLVLIESVVSTVDVQLERLDFSAI